MYFDLFIFVFIHIKKYILINKGLDMFNDLLRPLLRGAPLEYWDGLGNQCQ